MQPKDLSVTLLKILSRFSDMLKPRYLCVLADGSTDSSIVEQEVISVRYIQNRKSITNMISVQALSSGTSESVQNGSLNGLSETGINNETLKEDSGQRMLVLTLMVL